MEREQLTAIAAARGRPVGSKQTASRIDATFRAAIAARGRGRSRGGTSIGQVLGRSAHRSITLLRPGAKPRS